MKRLNPDWLRVDHNFKLCWAPWATSVLGSADYVLGVARQQVAILACGGSIRHDV
jgi:hypothetical protein